LPHVDAITIAVPNHLHAELCLQAIAAGVPALVEKPLCITADELTRLDVALRLARAPIHVGYRLRWNPALRAFRPRLKGARAIQCTYRLGIERLARGKEWTRRTAQSGGAFFTLGVHALDLARWLVDARAQPFENFHASASAFHGAADFPLLVSLGGVLSDGVCVEATADLRGDAPFQLNVDVEGSRVDLSRGWPGPFPEAHGAADAEYAGLIADFIRAIRTQSVDRAGLLEIIETHRELVTGAQITSRPS
jgi:predicted dehydrogenase